MYRLETNKFHVTDDDALLKITENLIGEIELIVKLDKNNKSAYSMKSDTTHKVSYFNRNKLLADIRNKKINIGLSETKCKTLRCNEKKFAKNPELYDYIEPIISFFDELSKIIEDDERCTCSIAYISEDTSFFNSHAVVVSKYSVRCLSLADTIETLIMMDEENKCSNKNSTCYNCIYFNACGDEERTEPCDGKRFNKENKS